MGISGIESNGIGGGFGGGVSPWGIGNVGGGGNSGFGLFGLLGLTSLQDLGGRRRGDDDGCAREAAILAAIANNNNTVVQEGRSLAGAICDAEKTSLQQFYAAAIQASNNTQEIKDQQIALAIANNQNLTEIKEAGVAQTAAILARINDAEVQRLRDELEINRHGLRAKELEISINNTNTNIQQQMQQQQQAQAVRDFEHQRRFDALFSQTAKAGQDIIAVGSLLTGTTQTANPVNVKS